jgi:predicted DNA-binding transcriptional regulator YafY
VNSDHDKLAFRLASILQKLNQGEKLDIDQLAADFSVHRRTIQRDLQERFAFLPLQKVDGLFCMEPAYLGRLSFKDIQHFAAFANLQGLFPNLDPLFLRELFDQRFQETLIVHTHNYENISQRGEDFRKLQAAVQQHQHLRFQYRKENETKTVEAQPYRMISHAGVWYLSAVNQGKVKAYAFGKMQGIQVQETRFTPDPDIAAMLEQEDSIWLNQNKTEVVLTIAPVIAPYFKRRKLIAQQTLVKELEDGGLIVSGKFAHQNQILPIVRYWIPHIRIISPVSWQEALEIKLHNYLDT